jgi:hypothetical protein
VVDVIVVLIADDVAVVLVEFAPVLVDSVAVPVDVEAQEYPVLGIVNVPVKSEGAGA